VNPRTLPGNIMVSPPKRREKNSPGKILGEYPTFLKPLKKEFNTQKLGFQNLMGFKGIRKNWEREV